MRRNRSRGRPADPPDDAYGRVTDAGRYRALHDVATALLGDLERDYDVRRRPGPDDPQAELEGRPTGETVALVPADSLAAPLTVTLTEFPGVDVRFGLWHVEAFPSCGCDACDEQPEELAQTLETRVGALVAGRFAEGLEDGILWYRFDGASWSSSGNKPLRGRAAVVTGPPGRHLWRPWRRRAPQAALSSR